MATDLEVGEPTAHAPPEVAADLDSKQEEPGAPAATTAVHQDPAQRAAATADAADGTNGVTPGDEMVVDEVSRVSVYRTDWFQLEEGCQAQRPFLRLTSCCSVVLRWFGKVIDAADDFGASRVAGRESSENGNDDEPSSRRGRRGRSRWAVRGRDGDSW